MERASAPAWLDIATAEQHRKRLDTGLVAWANPVAVGVVAAATAVSPRRGRADRSRADRRRTDTVAPIPAVAAIGRTPIAVAPAAHSDSTATSSSNCDSAAAVGSATATIAATSATASFGIVWEQTGGEQNECCKSSKNIAEHDKNLPMKSAGTGDCGALNAGG